MSGKIFKAIWIAAIAVFLASLVIILGISYQYFSSFQRSQLRNEMELAAQGVSLSGQDYFQGLKAKNYRITWIDAEGKVLYDNAADSMKMENHLEREEVKEALETGYGEAVHYSNTLSDKELYAAAKLSDGSVLRLSIVYAAVWTLLLNFAQPILFVILLVLIFSFILASRLAKVIVKPINEIDLNHPERYFGQENYKEVEPLLWHIAEQRKQIRADQEKIERTAMIRQEFTANVSHELKTPLQTISGHAELIENDLVKEEDVKPFAGKIRTEALRLSQLVEDIIDLTKLDNGGSETKWEKCDLFRIAQNAADSLDTAASAKDITLNVEGSEAIMTGDLQLLHSIVYNLCDNAIKYNRQGGSVRVSVTQNAFHSVLQVEDTGIGIPEDSLDRIFERFYRVDKSRSSAVGGTGLGLSIVKHAVMIHGGTIEVQSQTGEGTVFTVTLPREQEQ